MKPAICIEMLYPGLSPGEKIRRIARHGFGHMEFWGHGDKDIADVMAACADTGSAIVNFSGNRAGDLIDPATHGIVLGEIRESVSIARRLGTGTLMVLSNELGDQGRVVRHFEDRSPEEKRAALVDGLRKLMKEVPPGMRIVLEPLNTVLDHVGNFLSSTEEAAAIVKEVGDGRLGILCDFYHMAMMGEDPVATATRFAGLIGHVHVADYPGRHEPGTGKGPWKETLRALRENGYEGFVGFEFSPAGDSDAALESIGTLWKDAAEERRAP